MNLTKDEVLKIAVDMMYFGDNEIFGVGGYSIEDLSKIEAVRHIVKKLIQDYYE